MQKMIVGTLNKAPTPCACSVANSQICEIIGVPKPPFNYVIGQVFVVPAFSHSLILGMDVWLKTEIIPNMLSKNWFSSSGVKC